MHRNSLRIHPLAGAIGAEISGVDLAGEVDDDTIAAIRRAWLDHLVIFFRGQDLPPARFLDFARCFGEPSELVGKDCAETSQWAERVVVTQQLPNVGPQSRRVFFAECPHTSEQFAAGVDC